eukprot:9025829-Heterocapsa_arctica.AAC.1
MEHPAPVSLAIRWLMDRDHATRTKARSLFTDGYLWGVALVLAREVHCAVAWTCGQCDLVSSPLP